MCDIKAGVTYENTCMAKCAWKAAGMKPQKVEKGACPSKLEFCERVCETWLVDPSELGALALQTAAASTLGLSVGALSPSSEMALAVGPCVMVLSIMLGDETGAFAEIPESLTRVSHLSLIKWAFRGCLSSEFEGLRLDPRADAAASAPGKKKRGGGGACPPTGERVLAEMGLPTAGGARIAAKAQAKVVAANALLTYLVLKVRGA